jgi:hypothetical protein
MPGVARRCRVIVKIHDKLGSKKRQNKLLVSLSSFKDLKMFFDIISRRNDEEGEMHEVGRKSIMRAIAAIFSKAKDKG